MMVNILIPIEKDLMELVFQLYELIHKIHLSGFFKEIEKKPIEFVVFVIK